MTEDHDACLKRTPLYDGRVVRLALDTVRFPDGSTGQLELVRHRGAAAVLPVFGDGKDADPDVLLVRQYRYAAGGPIYEVPAGIVEPGESWADCARRELEEETGWRAGKLVKLTEVHTTPGFTNEVIRLFAAFQLRPGKAKRDEDEFLEVVRMPLSQTLAMAEAGEITDAKSLVALLFAVRFLLGLAKAAKQPFKASDMS